MSCIMVQKEESMGDLRNKNTAREEAWTGMENEI